MRGIPLKKLHLAENLSPENYAWLRISRRRIQFGGESPSRDLCLVENRPPEIVFGGESPFRELCLVENLSPENCV